MVTQSFMEDTGLEKVREEEFIKEAISSNYTVGVHLIQRELCPECVTCQHKELEGQQNVYSAVK